MAFFKIKGIDLAPRMTDEEKADYYSLTDLVKLTGYSRPYLYKLVVDGKIAWVSKKVVPKNHAKEVLDAFAGLKKG